MLTEASKLFYQCFKCFCKSFFRKIKNHETPRSTHKV